MSTDNLKYFFKKYKEEADFKDAIDNAPDIDAKRRIIKEAGLEFTKEEVEQIEKTIKTELTERELDNVVGGTNILFLTLNDKDFKTAKEIGL